MSERRAARLKQRLQSVFVHAIRNGHGSMAFGLMHEVDLKKQDRYGCTPVHWAALRQNIYLCADFLRNSPSEINVRGPRGYTPLHMALIRPNPRITIDLVKLLLRYGADAVARTGDGKSALDLLDRHTAIGRNLAYVIVDSSSSWRDAGSPPRHGPIAKRSTQRAELK